MRISRLFSVILLVIALAAVSVVGVFAHSADQKGFKAKLRGGNEVPAVNTRAKGEAEFELSEDGMALEYELEVKKISNVVAAHIHLGPAGQNGPVVAFLYGPAAAGGGFIKKSEIAEGVISADDLVGPLAGQPLSALLEAIRTGNAYVNVHTNDGVDPTNTGPGDHPGGEIRGQIR